jgi:hypothetical protein
MRASEGAGAKGLIGGLVGLVALGGAAVARLSDDAGSSPVSEVGIQSLDVAASSGEPEISYGRPSPRRVPQYVLVSRLQDLEGTLARCVAQRTWCVVERVDGEEPSALSARFSEHQRLWRTDHPTDAQWVASLGRSLPPGVEAAWLEADGEQWQIARPGR